jgi:hypothetical protein
MLILSVADHNHAFAGVLTPRSSFAALGVALAEDGGVQKDVHTDQGHEEAPGTSLFGVPHFLTQHSCN